MLTRVVCSVKRSCAYTWARPGVTGGPATLVEVETSEM